MTSQEKPEEKDHREPFWVLANRLRPIQVGRPYSCCRHRTAARVQLQRSADGTVAARGIETCSSVWACPLCARRIYAARAEEITHWAEFQRSVGRSCYMLTLTVRHAPCHRLDRLADGLRDCWKRFWYSRQGRFLKRALGLVASVRGLEINHGPNGWHPHLHIALSLKRTVGDDLAEALNIHWQWVVRTVLGVDFEPNLAHGTCLTPFHRDDYLAKLGLEIASILTKTQFRSGHRTPWAIAWEASEGNGKFVRLWKEYYRTTKGSRQLTWSRGTKRECGLQELPDELIANRDLDEPQTLYVPGALWDKLSHVGQAPLLMGLAQQSLRTAAIWLLMQWPREMSSGGVRIRDPVDADRQVGTGISGQYAGVKSLGSRYRLTAPESSNGDAR